MGSAGKFPEHFDGIFLILWLAENLSVNGYDSIGSDEDVSLFQFLCIML